MACPEFFDRVQTIRLFDPLAQVLGAFDDGVIEISYPEVVRAAGHSCPTVASAYLMTLKALEGLYPEGLPERGGVEVEFSQELDGIRDAGLFKEERLIKSPQAADIEVESPAGAFERRGADPEPDVAARRAVDDHVVLPHGAERHVLEDADLAAVLRSQLE